MICFSLSVDNCKIVVIENCSPLGYYTAGSYSAAPFYGGGHVPDILPSWAWTCFLTLFPYVSFFFFSHFTSIFSISPSFLLSFCFTPFRFLYYFPVSAPFFLFPLFFVSCCFIWVPSLPFLYYSDTFPPVCLYLGLVPRVPPLNFIVTELFFILISFLP